MKKVLVILFTVMACILTSCANSNPDDKTIFDWRESMRGQEPLVYVEQIIIYQERIDDAIKNNSHLKPQDAIRSAICEVLVFLESEDMGIYVDQREIDERVKELHDYYPEFYKLTIEQYGAIDTYTELLGLNMIYQEVKSHIVHEYFHENPLDQDTITTLMIEHGIIDEAATKIDDDLISAFLIRYDEVRGEDYFLQWLDGLYQDANIVYTELGQQYIDGNSL